MNLTKQDDWCVKVEYQNEKYQNKDSTARRKKNKANENKIKINKTIAYFTFVNKYCLL